MASDLTTDEQANVRAALRYLRARTGGWKPLGKALRLSHITLAHAAGSKTVAPLLAFRVARLAGVGVDDVLAGRFPEPGTCPTCGHRAEPTAV